MTEELQNNEISSQGDVHKEEHSEPNVESKPAAASETTADEVNYDLAPPKEVDDNTPEGIKARLGRQEKKHQRELAELRAKLQEIENAKLATQIPHAQDVNRQVEMPSAVNGMVFDPLSGQYVDPNSDVGRYAVYMNQVRSNMQRTQQLEQQQQAENLRRQELEQLNKAFESSISKSVSEFSDYEDVVLGASFTDAIVDASKLAPNAGKLLYFLAKNPKELTRISRLSPLQQAQEVMRHSIELGSRKNISGAPAPATPLGESIGTSKIVSADNYEQWKAHERERSRRGK